MTKTVTSALVSSRLHYANCRPILYDIITLCVCTYLVVCVCVFFLLLSFCVFFFKIMLYVIV